MTSILNMSDIDPRFRTGLIFSIFEGLLQGSRLQILLDKNPHDVTQQFESAHLPQMNWKVDQVEKSLWQITLTKLQHSAESCCGFCKGG